MVCVSDFDRTGKRTRSLADCKITEIETHPHRLGQSPDESAKEYQGTRTKNPGSAFGRAGPTDPDDRQPERSEKPVRLACQAA